MEIEATFQCVYCLQLNTVLIDVTGGTDQEYVEDCQVCCRPNQLIIRVDPALNTADVQAEPA